jgi:predicted DNA-binding antitoxin AbrB/MazE fold protein
MWQVRLPEDQPHMAITVEAVYENGVLKLTRPLPLQEHQHVLVTVEPALTWAERTAGLLPWPGDPDTLHQIAMEPEHGILESP